MTKILFYIFAGTLFIYILWPEPTKISQFRPLPDSVKSTLAGDSVQIPNVSAYFSNNFRDFVIPFYLKNYLKLFNLPFPALKINHPPEYSWKVIKNPTDTTYLEEFVYPLKNSLYVNGFETHRSDGSLVFYGAPPLTEDGKVWYTKVTLRLFTSNVFIRLIVWLEIIVSVVLIYKLSKEVIVR